MQQRQRFYRDLAALMKAGLSMGEAIDAIRAVSAASRRSTARRLAAILDGVRSRMRNGLSLSAALDGWVPDEERMAIAAMEAGDGLSAKLDAYSRSLKHRAEDRTKIAGELAYPGFLLLMVYGLLVHFHVRIAPVLGDLLPRPEWSGIARRLDSASGLATSNMLVVAFIVIAAGPAFAFTLRRWAGAGRAAADGLPVFSGYRARTGILFLKSAGSLMASGMTCVETIERIRPGSSPYMQHRLDLIRLNLLNGCSLGSAIELSGAGWPDRDMAISLKIMAGVPDFPSRLTELAEDWEREKREELGRDLALLRSLAFLVVFLVVSAMVLSIHSIQGQITSTLGW